MSVVNIPNRKMEGQNEMDSSFKQLTRQQFWRNKFIKSLDEKLIKRKSSKLFSLVSLVSAADAFDVLCIEDFFFFFSGFPSTSQ